MDEKFIVNKLLSSVLQKDKKGSLQNLREVFLNSGFSDDETAKKLVAYAHLACFSFDAREISFAIDVFSELGKWAELANILRLCKVYKVFKPILKIIEIGNSKNIPELQFPEFALWFKTAVKWFDMYYDAKGLFFIHEEDCELIKQIASEQPCFWEGVFSDSELSGVRKDLLEKLVNGEVPIVPSAKSRDNVEKQFLDYCRLNSISVIRRLQKGVEGTDKCSYVYLVLDNDGIFKVYKELLEYKDRLTFEHEGFAYRHLPETEFLPRCYGGPEGLVDIGEYKFLKLSVHFGQSLADYTKPENLLRENEALYVIKNIAKRLNFLRERGILYLDLKPENIILDKNNVKFLDLGIVKVLEENQEEADIFLADPRYVTPECGTKLRASEASLVYQLGILFAQLLTGKHPFDIVPGLDGMNRESAIIKYSWPSVTISPNLQGIRQDIVAEMLAKDPAKRPSLTDVADSLKGKLEIRIKQKGRERRSRENNTILFVGRMGIPHKGHIEYISRFLEMGFFVRIAIAKSYTITPQDPIPKWIVMKMIAQSLFYRGFSSEDFDFILTPFYETDKEMKMHYLMLPCREDIVGVASSNPDVERLFQDKRVFDQRSVFGYEAEKYQNLSWGEIVRTAVREEDYETFVSYAAEGVEDILSFSEIRKSYGYPEIEFVFGKVIAVLLNSRNEIIRGRVLKYSSPEQSLLFHLRNKGHKAEIIEPYSLKPGFVLDGINGRLCYKTVQLQGEDEIIKFCFEED